jgi:ADP-heptose:LPS heptosyltransferase
MLKQFGRLKQAIEAWLAQRWPGYWPARHQLTYHLFFVWHWVQLSLRRRWLAFRSPGRPFIVINLLEHFGDIVACEPVSRYVRKQYPEAYIVWTTRRAYRELVDHNPNIDETVTLYCLSEWIRLARCNLFDQVIDLHFSERVCPVCRIPLKKPADSSGITPENYYHFGNLLTTFCISAGLPPLVDQPQLYLPDQVRRRVDALRLPEDYIVVHCLSNEISRDWLKPKWQELARLLIAGRSIAIVEVGMKALLGSAELPAYHNCCGRLSILETAEVIRRSRLFIGVDSGPAQLANALQHPGVVLLGHYRDFVNYMPYSGCYQNQTAGVLLYADGPVATLPVEEVLAKANDCLAGSPGGANRLPEAASTPTPLTWEQDRV